MQTCRGETTVLITRRNLRQAMNVSAAAVVDGVQFDAVLALVATASSNLKQD